MKSRGFSAPASPGRNPGSECASYLEALGLHLSLRRTSPTSPRLLGAAARDLDPAAPQVYWMHGRMLIYQGKAREAEEEIRRGLELFPNQFKLLTFLGASLYYQGRTEEAMQSLDRAVQVTSHGDDEEPMVIGGFLHASRGERDKIDPRIFQYKPEDIVDGDLAEWLGAVHALLGEKDLALAFLRQAVRRGNHNFPWFLRDKNWDKLRVDPEFQRIMSEVEGYWKHYTELFGKTMS